MMSIPSRASDAGPDTRPQPFDWWLAHEDATEALTTAARIWRGPWKPESARLVVDALEETKAHIERMLKEVA